VKLCTWTLAFRTRKPAICNRHKNRPKKNRSDFRILLRIYYESIFCDAFLFWYGMCASRISQVELYLTFGRSF